ncbi:SRPBCC family protein [Cellulomonas sp. Sa3CUA2]|uniref:SRPBCC family protein n=1 Tax=Cellulomonas avistercoris TaxID=2762242 RepID=A0ABR8QGD8_9CELL|nr:SRPBCC family protein [Cellulomonas avistercoris]MBD7919487.1 SRPBCC family protein [Cellulomonas avistercoris]
MSARTPDDGTVTIGPDAAEVTFRRPYATTPEDLWDAVTDPDRARRWLGALHGDLRQGGTYELRMGEDRPDADDVAHGEILLCEPPRVLELTWRFPGERESRVRATVEQDGEGALLVLRHTALDAAAARGYGGGWHVLLDQLDDHCAGRPVRAWDELYGERSARYADAG